MSADNFVIILSSTHGFTIFLQSASSKIIFIKYLPMKPIIDRAVNLIPCLKWNFYKQHPNIYDKFSIKC